MTRRLQNALDKVQIELQCCGTVSYSDWFNTEWANNTGECTGKSTALLGYAVPTSCCKATWSETVNQGSSSINQNTCYCGNSTELAYVNQQGCLTILFGNNGQTLYYLLGTAFGCALVQLVSMVLSFCIFCKLKDIRSNRRGL